MLLGVPPVSWQFGELLACFQCIRFAHSLFPSASYLGKFLLRSPGLVYRGIAAGEEIKLRQRRSVCRNFGRPWPHCGEECDSPEAGKSM